MRSYSVHGHDVGLLTCACEDAGPDGDSVLSHLAPEILPPPS